MVRADRETERYCTCQCFLADEEGKTEYVLVALNSHWWAAAVLVYDITDTESFDRIKRWVKELKTQVGNEITICIAGNKIDLEKRRSVSSVTAKRYVMMALALVFRVMSCLRVLLEKNCEILASDLFSQFPLPA